LDSSWSPPKFLLSFFLLFRQKCSHVFDFYCFTTSSRQEDLNREKLWAFKGNSKRLFSLKGSLLWSLKAILLFKSQDCPSQQKFLTKVLLENYHHQRDTHFEGSSSLLPCFCSLKDWESVSHFEWNLRVRCPLLLGKKFQDSNNPRPWLP
jgi:hypothetical protein